MPSVAEVLQLPDGTFSIEYSDGSNRVVSVDNILSTEERSLVQAVVHGAGSYVDKYLRPKYYMSESLDLYQKLLRDWCAVKWRPLEVVSIGMCRVTTTFESGTNTSSMKIHRCTTGGVTGSIEPTWTTTSGSTTSDGAVVWTAYPAYFFDSDNGDDTSGDGSQLTPWKTFAKMTVYGGSAVLRTGNAVFLKRGTSAVYGGTQPSVSRNQVISVQKDGSDTGTERRNIEAYGIGKAPVLDAAGCQFGINFATTNTSNNSNATISGLVIKNVGTDPTPGNQLGGVGIYVPTDVSSRATNVKVFNTEVSNVRNPLTSAVGTDDFNGIRISGTGSVVAACRVYNIDDDGLWLDGIDDTTVILNHIFNTAMSYNTVGRIAGDCIQVSASGAANNVRIWSNIVDHSNAACKHAIIGNPSVSSSGWSVLGNLIIGQKSVEPLVCYPLYLARMTGEVRGNIIYSQSASHASGGHILIAAGLAVENNIVYSRNAGGGFNITVSGDSGSPKADNSTCHHNTIVGQGEPAAFGISVASVITGESVYNNSFVNVLQPVSYTGSGTLGPIAVQSCGQPYIIGNPNRDGFDIEGETLFSPDGRPLPGSQVTTAGVFLSVRTGPDDRRLSIPTTIGAIEPDNNLL